MDYAVKYPRTMHLDFSPGLQNDDRVMPDNRLIGREVVVTEKMDGENTTMYCDNIHARSIDGRHHPSRDWVKRFWGQVRHNIPLYTRVCGENMYAQHSIVYHDLESYFYGFGIWDNNVLLGWDPTVTLFQEWGITPVPVLWRGTYSDSKMKEVAEGLDLERQEGFVVRAVDSVNYIDFSTFVGKWVRSGHVQTDVHWMHAELKVNKLQEKA